MTHRPETLEQLQAIVDQWISQWEEGYWSPLSNLARLTEEVGELARILNELHGEKPAADSRSPSEIADELGDVLFVVITLANSLDVDLTEALHSVLQKYDIRDGQRFTPRDPSSPD